MAASTASLPIKAAGSGEASDKEEEEAEDGQSLLRLAWSIWPILLGNVMEWYEFSVYAYLAPQIEANFFEGSSYGVWLGFAFTFLARPFGGTVLGWMGDRFGRRLSMSLSILGMLVATVCQGFLPSYRSGSKDLGMLGFVGLLILRVVQGLSAGGEVGAITCYLAEVAPLDKMGRVTALMPFTAGISYLLTSCVVEMMVSMTSEEAMLDWGWRVPFILALPPGLLTLWGRRNVPESELFLQEMKSREASRSGSDADLQQSRMKVPDLANVGRDLQEVLRNHGYAVLVVVGYLTAPCLGLYVATMWVISYLEHQGLPPTSALSVSIAGRVLNMALTLWSGWLIDKLGIGWVNLVGNIILLIIGLPIFWALSEYGDNVFVALLGVSIGYCGMTGIQCSVMFCAELFPTKVRTLGLGFSWNVAAILFAGFGGIMAEASLKLSPLGPGWLISGSSAISVATMLWAKHLHSRGIICIAHRRPSPYWGLGEPRSATEETDGHSSGGLSSSEQEGGPPSAWCGFVTVRAGQERL